MECRYEAENLLAYVDNQLAPEEAKNVEKHISICQKCKDEVNELRNVTSLLGKLPDIEFSEDIRLRLSNKLKESILEEEPVSVATPVWKMWKFLAPVLASATCLIFVYVAYLEQGHAPSVEPGDNTVEMASIATLNLTNNLNLRLNGEKINYDGDLRHISLKEEDSLSIGQGSNALIKYPGDINIEVAPGSKLTIYDRWLHLKHGNGYFKLAKQHSGFQVTSPTVTVTVIGTTFDVGVKEDGSSKVSLYEGVISFETKKGKNVMKPGQTLNTSANGEYTINATNDNVDKEIIFKDRRNAAGN